MEEWHLSLGRRMLASWQMGRKRKKFHRHWGGWAQNVQLGRYVKRKRKKLTRYS
jgi:hypothetical protein